MKIILQQYTGVVVAVFITALIFFVFSNIQDEHGNKGVKEILKEEADIQIKKGDGADENANRMYANRKKPVIIYTGGRKNQIKHMEAGKYVNLYDFFQAKDSENKSVNIKVIRVEDSVGNVLIKGKEAKQGKIFFDTAGKYYVVLQAVDQEKRTVIQRFAVPVDNAV